MKPIITTLFFFCFCLINQDLYSQQKDYDLLLHTGIETFSENFNTVSKKANVASEETFDGYYFRLIQFYNLPKQEERAKMEAEGLRFLSYVPHYTYLVAVPVDFEWTENYNGKVRSVFEVDPDWKTAANLTDEINNTPSFAGAQIEVLISYPSIFTREQIEEACISNGITVVESSRYSKILKASIPIDEINEKVKLPFISFIEKMSPDPELEDIHGRTLHRSNLVDSESPSGYHFNGDGVSVQVRDDGNIGPHIDFQGRVDNSFIPGSFSGSHGTRVASVLGGAGNIDPYGKGMADGAYIYGTDYESTFLDATMELHFDKDVMITNSSYGNGCNGGYQSNTQTIDQQIYDNPSLIHVFSTGNSGGSDCSYGAGSGWGNITGGHKQGKSVIATASVAYDGVIANSSSRGPATDGRIKPDIAAQGIVYAATPNNGYTETSGTSFASPSIVGVLAQLYQAYKAWNGGANPESALMKACLLNTANDLGNVGPDFTYGWGHVNAYRAMKMIEENRYSDALIEDGEENEHSLNIGANVKQIRVMIYWADVAGNPISNKALVNNLDMQLKTPAGEVLFPYILNPAPNASTLNLAATNGVDDLNNMEQVVIDFPTEGLYSLVVSGTEIPMGAQKYYVLWEIVKGDLMLTYPNGGECLSPDIEHTIHWDAHGDNGDFLLEYSPDNGATWQPITTVNGSTRNYDWTVPTTFTGLAQVRVTRNGVSDSSDATFSLMAVPQNVEVTSACPGFLRLTWDPIPGNTKYVVYALGAQYMDSIGLTTTTTFDLPITNPFNDNWYAVSSIGPNNACSPRNYAQNYNGGIFNCVVTNDVAIGAGNICEGVNYICQTFNDPLSLLISNNGLNQQSNIDVSYILNGGNTITENFSGPLVSGESIVHTFANLLQPLNGTNTIQAWVSPILVDEVPFNDTITYTFEIEQTNTTPVGLTYVQDFESGTFPPVDWVLNNPDGGITWEPVSVVGAFGNTTTAAKVNNFAYNSYGEQDELVTVPVDLTTSVNPTLSFDVAYARYADDFADTLSVRLRTLCSGSCASDVIYHKIGTELSTVVDQGSSWEPVNQNEWRNEVIDLSAYAGSAVLLEFVNTTGFGNGLFIDNINIFEEVAPVAGFELSQTLPCVFDVVNMTNASTGATTSFEWQFGVDAVPATSTEVGPHDVYYSSPGTKSISLTVSGPLGNNTFASTIEVAPQPEASFSFTSSDAQYQFTNTSTMGNSFVWSFGDGATSTDENPMHTYDLDGDYTITLEVTNDCGTTSYEETISVILNGISEENKSFHFDLSPNPSNNDVNILLTDTESRTFQLELYDARGQLLASYELQSKNGTETKFISATKLPAGAYWFKLINEEGAESKRWIKM